MGLSKGKEKKGAKIKTWLSLSIGSINDSRNLLADHAQGCDDSGSGGPPASSSLPGLSPTSAPRPLPALSSTSLLDDDFPHGNRKLAFPREDCKPTGVTLPYACWATPRERSRGPVWGPLLWGPSQHPGLCVAVETSSRIPFLHLEMKWDDAATLAQASCRRKTTNWPTCQSFRIRFERLCVTWFFCAIFMEIYGTRGVSKIKIVPLSEHLLGVLCTLSHFKINSHNDPKREVLG